MSKNSNQKVDLSKSLEVLLKHWDSKRSISNPKLKEKLSELKALLKEAGVAKKVPSGMILTSFQATMMKESQMKHWNSNLMELINPIINSKLSKKRRSNTIHWCTRAGINSHGLSPGLHSLMTRRANSKKASIIRKVNSSRAIITSTMRALII